MKYIVVCKHPINNKGMVVGWTSQPKSTRYGAEQLIKLLEKPPSACDGPHEIKEFADE